MISDDDDDDNRSASLASRAHDLLLNRVHTPPLTRTRSPFTLSSQASSRNMLHTPAATRLVDENRYLNDELNRIETILNLTRAEKDEVSIRYNALSDRVSGSNDSVVTLSSLIEDLEEEKSSEPHYC